MSDPLELLLEAQGLDIRLDQLAHQRVNLPERSELDQARERVRKFASELEGLRTEKVAVGNDERRLEDEASSVEEKSHHLDSKMSSTTSPKELMAMQQEMDLLKSRQLALEDEAITLMERIEELDGEMSRLDGLTLAESGRADLLARSISEQEAVVDSEIERLVGERDALLARLPAELVERYTVLRGGHDRIAVARLEGGRCGGCHLALSAVELDDLRHAPVGAEILCPECGRLLVR